VAFDFQLLDEVPSAPHDVRLHGVVTDGGAWWCTKMRIR
jgi:5-formyltetrahydrofolate cyclo-ligase